MSDLVVVTVISSTVALLVAIGGSLFYGRRLRLEMAKEAHGELRTEQWRLYDSFRAVIARIFSSIQTGRELTVDSQMQRDFTEISTKVWLVGSPELLYAYNAWRAVTRPNDTLVRLADIVGAMRNDLAPSAKRVTRRSILATIINDLDDNKFRLTGLDEPAGYFASRGTWRWPLRRFFMRASGTARIQQTVPKDSESDGSLGVGTAASAVAQTIPGESDFPRSSGPRNQPRQSRPKRRRKRGQR